MKTILYSIDGKEKNELIDAEVVNLLDKNSKITYIPSQSDPTREHFEAFKNWYGSLGYKNISYFDLDKEYEPSVESAVLDGDVIYLSGGNTYYFLRTIIRRNFKQKLIDFVKKGKVLIGTSAGAMIMCPSIQLSTSSNDVKVNPKEALGILNFDFFPHYDRYEKGEEMEKSLETRSKEVNVIAVRDGEGLIIWEDDKFIIGEPLMYFMGNKEILERF